MNTAEVEAWESAGFAAQRAAVPVDLPEHNVACSYDWPNEACHGVLLLELANAASESRKGFIQ